MYDETDLMTYKTAMHIIRRWLKAGLITESDFARCEAVVSERFAIPENSVWRERVIHSDMSNKNLTENEEYF